MSLLPSPARGLLGLLVGIGMLTLVACGGSEGNPDGLGGPTPDEQPSTQTGSPNGDASDDASDDANGDASDEPDDSSPSGPVEPEVVGTVATGLVAPWGIDFLPDGTALVTERDTTKVLAIRGGSVRTVGTLEGAQPEGEAGLLGLAVSPTYDEDSLVFAYFTSPVDNRVVKMVYNGKRLGPPEVVLKGIPSGFIHDGGRLEFGPDGYLYVSTGETGKGQLAQDPASLGGKILRITTDGDPAPGNPVKGSPVWTMGHRNVQGLAFDDRDRLWASEFGESTWDELNLIEKALNYGWPVVEGKGDLEEYRNPFAQWRTAEASPSGLAYLDGALWMASLRGERLWQIELDKEGISAPKDFFVGDFGRLRTVVAAPDGNLWVSTSNRDGRGTPGPKDDQILEITLR
ncbi:MAG TPA: PQQ-dependent sugar dehydrogenase [Nocardioidaceae bacterium]|nr:PQQ-dependent sugar dehydrogenase [Nocardioidaceae bacterium]